MDETEIGSVFDEDLLVPKPDTTDDPSPDAGSGDVGSVAATADSDTETPPGDVHTSVDPAAASSEKATVPLATFLETKHEAKAAREQNDQLAKRLDLVMDMVQRQQKPPEEPTAPKEPVNEIDPDEDLVGYLKRENELLVGKMKELTTKVDGTAQVAQGQAEQQNFMTDLASTEEQFRAAAPDYDQAIDHIRAQERQTLGFHLQQLISAGRAQPMDEAAQQAAVEAQLRRNEIQAAYTYRMQGINPVKAMYDLAKARGFAPPASIAAATIESPEAKRVREKAEQQADAQTLGAGGAELTRDVIESGEYDEFEAALKGRFG